MAPGSGILPDERRPELLVAVLFAVSVLGGAAFAGALVVAVMTAAGALGANASLPVLVGLLLTILVCGAAAAGATAWLAWLALAGLRTGVAAGWRRLLWAGYTRARRFEDETAVGGLLRPASLFASRSDRDGPLVEELKSRYVAGELDEREFERELSRLLGGGAAVGERVRREIAVTAADGGDRERRTGQASERGGQASERGLARERDRGAGGERRADREPERE